MLKTCTKLDYQTYVDFIYQLSLDQTKSGYPTYCDGIKTKEMFLERSKKAFSRKNEEILLFEYDGKVEGWIHYYWLVEDFYLSTVSFNISTHIKLAIQEFLTLAHEKFTGYDLFLGFPFVNKNAIDFLSTNGFSCIEQSYNNTFFLNKYESTKTSEQVIRITKDNFTLFSSLHCQFESDMYWTADKIYADMNNWIIYVKIASDKAVGSVYYMTADDGWYEIFGIDQSENVFNPITFSELVEKALGTAKALDGKYMTFFCNEQEQEIVSKLGFKTVGKYFCFKKHLN